MTKLNNNRHICRTTSIIDLFISDIMTIILYQILQTIKLTHKVKSLLIIVNNAVYHNMDQFYLTCNIYY